MAAPDHAQRLPKESPCIEAGVHTCRAAGLRSEMAAEVQRDVAVLEIAADVLQPMLFFTVSISCFSVKGFGMKPNSPAGRFLEKASSA